MYDSSRKMVSSTWFSAESNLQGKRIIVRIGRQMHQKGKHSFVCAAYLLIWSRKDSSCCFSGAVIISSTSVSCSGSAPLACRDARMASIRWDFSSRRLSVKQKTNQRLICDSVWIRQKWNVKLSGAQEQRGRKPELTCSLCSQTAVVLWGWLLSAWRRDISHSKSSIKDQKNMSLVIFYNPKLFFFFYLVAVLKQHSCSWELVDSVKIEGTGGSVVGSLWDFLQNTKIEGVGRLKNNKCGCSFQFDDSYNLNVPFAEVIISETAKWSLLLNCCITAHRIKRWGRDAWGSTFKNTSLTYL